MGACARPGIKCVLLTPYTQDFVDQHKEGRASIYACEFDPANTVYVIVNYGHSGGHTSTSAAAATDDLLAISMIELQHHPPGPAFICIDLNADPEDITILDGALKAKQWFDLGSLAHVWGNEFTSDFTCTTSRSYFVMWR